jgi:hypothetical protein
MEKSHRAFISIAIPKLKFNHYFLTASLKFSSLELCGFTCYTTVANAGMIEPRLSHLSPLNHAKPPNADRHTQQQHNTRTTTTTISQMLELFFSSGGVNGTSGGASLIIVSFMSTSSFFEMGLNVLDAGKCFSSQGEKDDELFRTP